MNTINDINTRKFKASYKGKETYSAFVKLFPLRFADISFELSILKPNKGKINDKDEEINKIPMSSTSISKDIKIVLDLLENNPKLLKGNKRTIYTTKLGDTVSNIALKFNTTEANIIKFNPALKGLNEVYPNQVLTIDTIRELDDNEKEVKLLKLYFDYVLNHSFISKLARRKDNIEQSNYRNILFGNYYDINQVDTRSIYGKIRYTYLHYFDKMGHIKDNMIDKVINILYVITDEVEDRINLKGTVEVILNFSKFRELVLKNVS